MITEKQVVKALERAAALVFETYYQSEDESFRRGAAVLKLHARIELEALFDNDLIREEHTHD